MLSFSLLNSQHTTEPEPKHRAKAEEEKHFMLFSLCFASFRSQRVLLELRIDEKRRKKVEKLVKRTRNISNSRKC